MQANSRVSVKKRKKDKDLHTGVPFTFQWSEWCIELSTELSQTAQNVSLSLVDTLRS